MDFIEKRNHMIHELNKENEEEGSAEHGHEKKTHETPH
jgi:hypothetical protein